MIANQEELGCQTDSPCKNQKKGTENSIEKLHTVVRFLKHQYRVHIKLVSQSLVDKLKLFVNTRDQCQCNVRF